MSSSRPRGPSLPLSPPETEAMSSSYEDPPWQPQSHRRTSSVHYTTTQAPPLTTSRPTTNKLLIVTPPSHLPHSPPPIGAQHARAFGPSGRFDDGILIPVQPTLGGQLALVSREYGLPSIVGVSLYLFIEEEGTTFRPKLSEETWTACWGAHLVDDEFGKPAGPSAILRPKLPIAGKVEFDIDERRAKWYASWRSDQGPRLVDVVHQAIAHARGDPSPSPLANRRASVGQRRLILEDRSTTQSPAVSPRSIRRPTSPRTPPRPLALTTARALPTTQEAPSPLIAAMHRHRPSEDRGVTAPVDANEPWSASWPPTPDSPDRLPSASLADRVAPSTAGSDGQMVFAAATPSKAYVPTPGPELVGVDHAMRSRMRQLRDISEPSPVLATFPWRDEAVLDPWLQRRADLRYPYSLSDIYPAVSIPRLYPESAANDIAWPLRLHLTSSQQYSDDEPPSPYRLPSASLADRLAHSSADDAGFAVYRSEPAASTVRTPEPPLVGVDRATQAKMRSIKEVSELSPKMPSWRSEAALDPWLEWRTELRYPYSLSTIYPMRDPLRQLYPVAAASQIDWPVRALHSAYTEQRFSYPTSLSLIYPRIATYPPLPYPSIVPSHIRRPAPPPPAGLASKPRLPPPPPLPAITPRQHHANAFVVLADPFAEEAEDDDEAFSESECPRSVPSSLSTIDQFATASHSPAPPLLGSPPLALNRRTSYLIEDDQSVRSMGSEALPSGVSASFPGVPGGGPMLDSPRSLGKSSLASSIPSGAPLQPEPILFTFPTTLDLSDAIGQFIEEAVEQSVTRRGRFTVALSGGNLPAILASSCVGHPNLQWDRWEVFYAEEKLVPLDDSESTHRLCDDLLWSRLPLAKEQIHAIRLPTDFDPKRAKVHAAEVADAYERELVEAFSGSLERPPAFDLVLLGLGADGSTAALFPNHALLAEQDYWISHLTDAPSPASCRLTFTYPLLNASRRVAFVVDGATRAAALAETLDEGTTPAALVALPYRPVVYFTTEEAAEKVVTVPRAEFWDA